MLEAKTIKDIIEPKQKQTPKCFDDGVESHVYSTPKDLFRHHYFDVLNLIIGEITNRFDQPTFTFIQNVKKLFIDAANGHEVSIPPEIRKCYENDVDFDRFKQQLQSLPDLCSNFVKVTNVDTIVQVLVESTPEQLDRFSVKSQSCSNCILPSQLHPVLLRGVSRHFVKESLSTTMHCAPVFVF